MRPRFAILISFCIINFIISANSINLFLPLNVITFPITSVFNIINRLSGRGFNNLTSKLKKKLSNSLDQIREKSKEEILEENLRDLSIAYDVLRDQMAIMKRYNSDQKSKLKQLNRELESSKREYNTNIENLKNLFEQELTRKSEEIKLIADNEIEKLKIELKSEFNKEREILIKENEHKVINARKESTKEFEKNRIELEVIIKDLKEKLKFEQDNSRKKDNLIRELDAHKLSSSKVMN
jgi:hypothetical protein